MVLLYKRKYHQFKLKLPNFDKWRFCNLDVCSGTCSISTSFGGKGCLEKYYSGIDSLKQMTRVQILKILNFRSRLKKGNEICVKSVDQWLNSNEQSCKCSFLRQQKVTLWKNLKQFEDRSHWPLVSPVVCFQNESYHCSPTTQSISPEINPTPLSDSTNWSFSDFFISFLHNCGSLKRGNKCRDERKVIDQFD